MHLSEHTYYRTRNKRRVYIHTVDGRDKDYPVVGEVEESKANRWEAVSWTTTGHFLDNCNGHTMDITEEL